MSTASFITGQRLTELSADFVSNIEGRSLEDDAAVNFRMDGGTHLRLWTSSIAVGRMHGFTVEVFGEKGGLRWAQEWPNQLYWTPLGGRTEIMERGASYLTPEAARASRIAMGHPEGMLTAFANIYADLAETIRARKDSRDPDPLACHYPSAEDGLQSVIAVAAAVKSAKSGGAWTKITA